MTASSSGHANAAHSSFNSLACEVSIFNIYDRSNHEAGMLLTEPARTPVFDGCLVLATPEY
jgi:hypothetical protein